MQSISFHLLGDTEKPGFMPRIWQLIAQYPISGWIAQDGDHAVMQLDGEADDIRKFIEFLLQGAMHPMFQLKEIRLIDQKEKDPPATRQPFKLLSDRRTFPEIRPDHGICEKCRDEMCDPKSRRFAYPFWSCDTGGAAYSVQQTAGEMRRNTLFTAFPPCRKCSSEQKHKVYGNVDILCCPQCGPHAFLLDREQELLTDHQCYCEARKRLAAGEIIAMQTLYGGYQLLCNGTDRDAILKLRKRRKMPFAPFRVVVRNMELAKKICHVSPEEETLLSAPSAPTLLLRKKDAVDSVFPADLVSPEGPFLAVSLPQTGQLHLLMEHVMPEGPAAFEYLVSSMAISLGTTLDELFDKLKEVADCFLCNDLHTGFDCMPSVVVCRADGPHLLRRSRGYVPAPIKLKIPLERHAAAFGNDRNATVAIGSGQDAIPSQYLGDVRNEAGAAQLEKMLQHMFLLFDTAPDVIACDMNPDLYTSKAAAAFADRYAIPLILVQTHHARALACMAEHGLDRALALVFGNGEPGPDGNYWGAELLEVGIENFKRLGSFAAESLPGAGNALTRPNRQLAGRLLSAGVPLSEAFTRPRNIHPEEAEQWTRSYDRKGKFAVTHAAMRLFDAVSAAIGLAPDFCAYPGQAAMRLYFEAQKAGIPAGAISRSLRDRFQWEITEQEDGFFAVNWNGLFRNFADSGFRMGGTDTALQALAFHDAVAEAACQMVIRGAERSKLKAVVLCGPLFIDEILASLTVEKLKHAGFRVFEHKLIPADGSGIAVGQLYHAGISR